MLPAFLFASVAVVGGELPLGHHDVSLIALTLATGGGIIVAVVATWAVMRRRPPIEREIDDRIAAALNALDHRLSGEIKTLRKDVLRSNQDQRNTEHTFRELLDGYRKENAAASHALQKSVEEGFKDIHRALGRLEGRGQHA